MSTESNVLSVKLCLAPALLGALAIAGSARPGECQDAAPQAIPVIPDQPEKSPVTLISAQRFDLEKAAPHYYRVGSPLYKSGWLLVLEVNPALVFPRQTEEPVLYVGSQTAERVNVGFESGKVVAIVPGDFFLVDTPIFFGPPAIPEELGQAQIDAAVKRAVKLGVKGPDADAVEATIADPLSVQDVRALRSRAIDLVEKHSPQERDLIEGWRVPTVR